MLSGSLMIEARLRAALKIAVNDAEGEQAPTEQRRLATSKRNST